MKKVNLTGLYVLSAITGILFFFFQSNAIYLALGILVLWVILNLTWRQNMPNVFTFMLSYHWLQIISYIFYINNAWDGNMSQETDSSARAYLCGMGGLVVMSLVCNRVAYKKINISAEQFERELKLINPQKVLVLYLALYFISNFARARAFQTSSLTQVFLNIALLKWAGFILLGFIAVKNKAYRKYFLMAFLLEFVIGFFSYFSNFKDVFLYGTIIALAFVKTVDLKTALRGFIAGLILFSFALGWTIVKGDYRSFLNNDQGAQVVVVTQNEAFSKLGDLVSGLNSSSINDGMAQLFYRLQYVYHLSKAMDMVPAKIPYQKGAVWKETLSYILTPRIFNADKSDYSASVRATKFTGIAYSGKEQGVSFSLGYFADCYIDFGIPGMFFAIGAIAWLWSKIFRFFLLKTSKNLVFNYAIVAAFFVQFCLFEVDGTVLLGKMLSTFVVFLALKLTLFKNIGKYIYY